MALTVQPVNSPTFTGIGSAPKQTITSVGVATPGSNGFPTLVQPKAPAQSVATATSANNSLQAQTNALLAAIARLQNSQPKQVYAPALDFASINAQARSAAEANVNPYYTKQLNDFLAEQAAKRSQTEAQAQTNISQLQTDLTNKLQGNDITKARTAEDTATNLDQLTTQADQNQVDSGTAFSTDRLQQGRDLAKAGLTGGLGAQQVEGAQIAHNTTEERATAATDQAKQQQELTKARTFEDLERSGTLATQAKDTGVKQVNVDLADFITNQGFETESKKGQLEAQRLGAVAQEQQNQGKLLVNNFIASIADPASRQAAQQAYGGSF